MITYMKGTMKRLMLVLLIVAATGTGCSAQTALFKKYYGRRHVQASCIKDYPIGNSTTVTVTMLQCSNRKAYNTVSRELRALPYKHQYGEQDAGPITKLLLKAIQLGIAGDTLTLSDTLSMSTDAIYDFLTDATMSAGDKETKPSRHIDVHAADPLPGDKYTYAIFFCASKRAILVFHCPSRTVYSRAVEYIINKELGE